MLGILYDTEDQYLCWQIHAEVFAVEASGAMYYELIVTAHQWHTWLSGFMVTLKCYRTQQHGGCGKQQATLVLLL